jgi:hypothetical protein
VDRGVLSVPRSRQFTELLIDLEEDPLRAAVVVRMLRERTLKE